MQRRPPGRRSAARLVGQLTPLSRRDIFQRHPWLRDKERSTIIFPGLDGMLSATFLHHHLGWRVTGYYENQTLWLSPAAREEWSRLVWVDLDACHPGSRSIGHGVLAPGEGVPTALRQCCNPNLMAGMGADRIATRYPFSTIMFLLWLHDVRVRKSLVARLLVLAAESAWVNIRQDRENCLQWRERLAGYNWKWLFTLVDTELFERRMHDQLLAPLERLTGRPADGTAGNSRPRVPGLNLQFNPDWEEDLFLKVSAFAGTHLKWSPPRPPAITERIEGQRQTVALAEATRRNFPGNLIGKGVISYAITGTGSLNFTAFPKEV